MSDKVQDMIDDRQEAVFDDRAREIRDDAEKYEQDLRRARAKKNVPAWDQLGYMQESDVIRQIELLEQKKKQLDIDRKRYYKAKKDDKELMSKLDKLERSFPRETSTSPPSYSTNWESPPILPIQKAIDNLKGCLSDPDPRFKYVRLLECLKPIFDGLYNERNISPEIESEIRGLVIDSIVELQDEIDRLLDRPIDRPTGKVGGKSKRKSGRKSRRKSKRKSKKN